MALIAHYKLNGDLKDSVGNNHGEPVTSATPSFSDGVIGLCGKFNVSPIGSDVGWNINKEFSYSFWAIRDGSDGSSIGGLVGNHYHSNGPTGANIYFANNNTQIRYAAGDGTDRPSYTVDTPTPTNVWNHYVLSYDGITMRLYQNGEMIHRGNRTIKQDTSRGWAIGRWAASHSNYYLVGRIDDVRIFDHALSLKEIQNLARCKIISMDIMDGHVMDLINPTSPTLSSNVDIENNKLIFNGDNGSAEFGDEFLVNRKELTIRVVAKPYTIHGQQMMVGNFGTNSRQYIGMRGGGYISMGIGNTIWGDEYQITQSYINYDIAISVNKETRVAKLYVDGKFITQRTGWNWVDIEQRIPLGRNITSTASPFQGEISLFEVYGTVLSDDDIKGLYQQAASIDNRGSIHTKRITESKSIGFQETPSGGSHNSYGMRFTVSKDTVIKSAKMRPYFTGNATVQLWDFDNQNSPLQEVKIEVTNGKIDLFDLNLFCQTGINYWLTVTGGNFMRTDAGIGFPRTHGTFTFTLPSSSGGSTADRWYYFFDLRYAELKSVERFQTSMGKISEKGLVDGLVAWYPLINDTDDYINRNDGVNNGAVAASDGYEFDGNSVISIHDLPFVEFDCTISFWIFIGEDSVGERRTVWNNGYSGEGTINYEGRSSTPTMRYYFGDEGDNTAQHRQVNSAPIATEEWTLVTAVRQFDPNRLIIYINGENPRSTSHSYERAGESSITTTIGDGYTSALIGKMRDVRVYDRALNSNEVARLYNTTKPDGSAVSLASDGIFIKNQIKEV